MIMFIRRAYSTSFSAKILAVLAVVGLAATGTYLLSATRAASFVFDSEVEAGARSGTVAFVVDTNASGGAAVRFAASSGGASCVGLPNTPGGADPWGSCWPGPHNTGYPHGLPGDTRTPVTLSDYTGPMTLSSCGVTIDSKTISGDLLITAGNGTHSAATPCITIKNSLLKGTIHTDTISQGPVVITDTEIAVPGSSWWASTGFYNTFDWRVNSHGGQGTIKCQAYCESHDSWVHGMYLENQYHYNAWGGNGIEAADAGFVIDHGYADCGGFAAKDASAGSDAGCSADIGFYGDFAPVRNITINKTFFAAAKATAQFGSGTQPGYCLNPGYYPGKPYPNPSNVVVTNNVFEKGPTGKCGEYGATNTWLSGNGNVWSGNTWDDGTVLNP